MRHILIATTITASTAAVATAAAWPPARPMRAAAAPPCTPKITKIQGHQAAVNCGPATATLHISGKTYTFRNGFCEQSKSAGAALAAQSGHHRYRRQRQRGQARLQHDHRSRSLRWRRCSAPTTAEGTSSVDDSLINVNGNIPSKGTFTSRVTVGAKFTGSWNCHGVVWQAP